MTVGETRKKQARGGVSTHVPSPALPTTPADIRSYSTLEDTPISLLEQAYEELQRRRSETLISESDLATPTPTSVRNDALSYTAFTLAMRNNSPGPINRSLNAGIIHSGFANLGLSGREPLKENLNDANIHPSLRSGNVHGPADSYDSDLEEASLRCSSVTGDSPFQKIFRFESKREYLDFRVLCSLS